jgi:hypothetical protein
MKKTLVLPAFLALGFSVCVIAQSEADYSGWMKDIAQTKGKVTKGVASKSADVATDAEHLAGLSPGRDGGGGSYEVKCSKKMPGG